MYAIIWILFFIGWLRIGNHLTIRARWSAPWQTPSGEQTKRFVFGSSGDRGGDGDGIDVSEERGSEDVCPKTLLDTVLLIRLYIVYIIIIIIVVVVVVVCRIADKINVLLPVKFTRFHTRPVASALRRVPSSIKS